MGIMMDVSGGQPFSMQERNVHIKLNEDGSASLIFSGCEIGQNLPGAAAQIAADALGVPYELIDVVACDTRSCPDGGMTTASRQTFVTGNAVKQAASALRARLAAILPVGASRDAESGAAAIRTARERALAAGLGVLEEALYLPPSTRPHRASAALAPGEAPSALDIHYAYCFASAAVAVEVDVATGAVRPLSLCIAQDVGVAINPMSIVGQIEGAAAMGLGYALSENFVANEGGIVTDTLRKLGVPRIADMPPIEVVIVQVPQPGGPFGAKGMGEVGLNPVAPAISNAIFDAVGVRLRSLPMTPGKVLEAMGRKA